jgi:drug/metabolite transporter (DMT)-like permease
MATIVVILSLLIGSIEPIVVKLGYGLKLPPFDLLVLRFIFSGIVIIPFAKSFKILSKEELKKIAPVCLLFSAINILIYISLIHLSAIAVITFITTTPALVAIVNQKKGKSILASTFWPGFFLIFLGVILTINIFGKGIGELSIVGILAITFSIIGSTIYRTQMDGITKEFGALLTSNYLFLSNGVFALFGLPFVNWQTGATTFYYGLWLGIAAVAANIAFLWAIKILGSTKISIWGTLQRPIVIILSALILKEPLSLIQIIGIILVLFGINLAKAKNRT